MNSVQTSFPSAVAVDENSNLYIADTNNNRVVLLPWSGSSYGKQITIASGFNAPGGIAIDGNSQLFVADSGNNRIVRIDLSSPAPMNFANAYLGSASPDGPQIAQVQNIGNQPISISSLSYPADFPESQGVSTPCLTNSSVSPGEFCEMGVVFTPQKSGAPLKEAVQITTSTASSLQCEVTIDVTGTSQGKLSQSITSTAPSGLTYGVTPFFLSGTAESGLPVTYTVVSGPAVLQNGGKALRITGAGTVQLAVDQSGNSTYWAANTLNVFFTVAPATLTVTAANPTVYYGSVPASIGYAITGFVNGDTALTALTGKPSITSTASNTSPVGSYPVVATQGTLAAPNYVFSYPPATLTVAKARLNLEVSSVIRYYGSPMNPLTWYLVGFVNGDTAALVTGAPILSTEANSGSAVGTYTITVSPGTLSAANYFFTGSTGVVIVNPGIITITPASLSMIYGAPVPQLTYWISGLANGDSPDVIHGSPVLSTTAGLHPGSGTYMITCQLGSLSAVNYTFRLSTAILTVNKAPLILAPVNTTMVYGSKIPFFTYTLIGFLNGDTSATTVTGAPALFTPANSASKPGTYMITSGMGTLQSANYRFSLGTAALAIGKSTLVVTVTPVSKTYGAALPSLTYSFSGLLNGDVSSSIQGQPQLSTKATAASPVGAYPITCNIGSLTSSSYNFVCAEGSLTINKAILTAKGSYLSMTYGGQVPALTYQLIGFVNGDDTASISGTPSLTSSVTPANAAGVYPMVVTAGSLKADSYIFVPSNGSITVQKAQLKVAAVPASSTYGSALPALSYTISGFLNGDTQQSAVTGAPQLPVAASNSSPAGNYAISPAAGTLASANYTFVFAAAWLTVNKAPLTVSANNLTMQAGGTVPALTYSFSGWINGDSQTIPITGSPVLATSATSNSAAGNYAISVTPGSLSSKNYQPVCVHGTLIVSQTTATLHRLLRN
ncbi:MAG TPA: MBG domain-containing protein [Acidobacteriaceae bacterium]|jgi:hypothetical protein|nr:MBG domain-containing protein [Acidobacteriaceae bacterium]